jgi:hypothetical protein
MSDIWKFASNFYFAFATSIYLLLLYLIINHHLLPNSLDFLFLKITYISKYDFILNMLIYFILPIMGLNYYIFYRTEKYKTDIKTYESYYNKKSFFIYFISAILTIFLILIFNI